MMLSAKGFQLLSPFLVCLNDQPFVAVPCITFSGGLQVLYFLSGLTCTDENFPQKVLH